MYRNAQSNRRTSSTGRKDEKPALNTLGTWYSLDQLPLSRDDAPYMADRPSTSSKCELVDLALRSMSSDDPELQPIESGNVGGIAANEMENKHGHEIKGNYFGGGAMGSVYETSVPGFLLKIASYETMPSEYHCFRKFHGDDSAKLINDHSFLMKRFTGIDISDIQNEISTQEKMKVFEKVKEMHQKHIIHNDIIDISDGKIKNIVIDSETRDPHIIDFGLSKEYSEEDMTHKSVRNLFRRERHDLARGLGIDRHVDPESWEKDTVRSGYFDPDELSREDYLKRVEEDFDSESD